MSPISALEQVGISNSYLQSALANPSTQDIDILIPVDPQSFRATYNVQEIKDSGRRGLDAMDFNVQRGVDLADISWSGLIQDGDDDVDGRVIVGYLLRQLMNNPGIVAGAGTPRPHYLKMGNVGSRSYFDVAHWVGGLEEKNSGVVAADPELRYDACRVTELTITFNAAEGALAYSVTLQGRGARYAGVKSVLTDRAETLFSGWKGGMYFGTGTPDVDLSAAGFSSERLISGEWTFRRSGKPVYTLRNSRQYTSYTLGPLEVMFTGMFEYESNYEYDIFLDDDADNFITKFGTLFEFGTGAARRVFGIATNRMSWFAQPAELDTSEEYVKLSLGGRALYDRANGLISGSPQNGPVEIAIFQENATPYA